MLTNSSTRLTSRWGLMPMSGFRRKNEYTLNEIFLFFDIWLGSNLPMGSTYPKIYMMDRIYKILMDTMFLWICTFLDVFYFCTSQPICTFLVLKYFLFLHFPACYGYEYKFCIYGYGWSFFSLWIPPWKFFYFSNIS